MASVSPIPAELEMQDARAILGLLSEVCRHGSRLRQIRLLMDGLCGIIDAKAWVWGASVRLRPDALPTWLLHLHSGFDEDRFARFLEAQEHPDMQRLTAPFAELFARERRHLTRSRTQTDPEESFRHSPAKPIWDAAGVAPGIMSCRPLADGEASIVGIFRGIDTPDFSARERRIAHILLSEVPWLHDTKADRLLPKFRYLSPRRLTVFHLLVEGASREEIGELLRIRLNTVNTYTKEVFRHFEVHSQAELIARFRQGGQGDGQNQS